MRKWYSIQNRATEGEAEIRIFGPIGQSFWDDDTTSASQFVKDMDTVLAADPKHIHLYIDSPGGDVFEGLTIYNTIFRVRDKVTSHIEGWAASIASIVALAAKRVEMSSSGIYMSHDPITMTWGNVADHNKALEILSRVKESIASIYVGKTGKTIDDVNAIMEAETWMTAKEALAGGFIDAITEMAPVSNCWDTQAWQRLYKHAPEVHNKVKPVEPDHGKDIIMSEQNAPAPASFADLKAGLTGADNDFICSQQEANATLVQAQSAWMAEQANRVAAAKEAEVAAKAEADAAKAAEAEAKAEAERARKAPPGVHAVNDEGGDNEESDPCLEWDRRVQAEMTAGKSKIEATKKVANTDPELRAAFVAAYNQVNKAARKSA